MSLYDSHTPLINSSTASSSTSSSKIMFHFKKELLKTEFTLHILRIVNSIIFAVSLALLIYSAVWTSKPGPTYYYSHFTSLYVSACLAFQALQVARVMFLPTSPKKWHKIFRMTYLTILALTGIMSGIAFCWSPKPDTVALEFLVFLDGIIGLCYVSLHIKARYDTKSEQLNHLDATQSSSHQIETRSVRYPKMRRCSFKFGRVCNRTIMVIHAGLSILGLSGALQLALAYSYPNPGNLIQVQLEDGGIHSINYNCTVVPFNGTTQPTIWFEGDAAHGVVDFLGVQTILAQQYERNSCSYDPPNRGWSDPLPTSLENFFGYFSPLLSALERTTEKKVLVGWGGGAENALMHAIEQSNTTEGLVFMDSSPDGIEWLDMQRENNWTENQMLSYRSEDLSGRVSLAQTILGLGIPWGLMPVFLPANSTGYFDQSQYPRFRAQGFKESLWAYQYYFLIQELSSSMDDYLTATQAPSTVPVFSMMTYNASNNEAGNIFYRETKLEMVNHVAGRDPSSQKNVVWCNIPGCSLSFPVNMPEWTAKTLMSLGI